MIATCLAGSPLTHPAQLFCSTVSLMTDQPSTPGAASPENRAAARYRFLLEDAVDRAVVLLDTVGNVLEWGGSATRFFGYRRDEMAGQHFRRLFFRPEEVQRGEPEF